MLARSRVSRVVGRKAVPRTTPALTKVFPLSIHSSGRYLIDAQKQPFPLIAESAWGLMVRLTSAQVDAYIADRRSRGFNVPTATSPTVVMTNFSQSSVRARWMDIVNGSFTTVSGSPFANTGSQAMTHPGNNSVGTSAWVLVMD